MTPDEQPPPGGGAAVTADTPGGRVSEAQATPACAPLGRALAATPEPPQTLVIVSWRRENWPAEWPTRRVMYDHLEDASAMRDRLERPERTAGEGPATSVRIDLVGAWIEARA